MDRGGAVYPRWRGEHAALAPVVYRAPGLSPLARGTQDAGNNGRRAIRFIPAGAGNTPLNTDATLKFAVYPRWRGEHNCTIHIELSCGGLSPLARGTRFIQLVKFTLPRFIPAGAGNTNGNALIFRNLAVYPRWRGEHANPGYTTSNGFGLSPLARGTRKPWLYHV